MAFEMLNPSPVPLPTGLVVKKVCMAFFGDFSRNAAPTVADRNAEVVSFG